MRAFLFVMVGLLLVATVASAAEISYDTASGPGTALAPTARDAFALTQNLSTNLVAGIYTCGNVSLGYTTEGWALRRFSLAYEFGIDFPFCVFSVDWGVRRYCALLDSVPQGPYIVNVELYSIPETDPFLFANMTLLESVPVAIAYLADQPIEPVAYHTPFPGTPVYPIGNDLVVAIHYPSGMDTTPATRFSPAGNSLGETLPGYVAFVDCGYPEPVTPGELGNTTPMVVFVVNGYGCGFPPVTGACCNPANGQCTITMDVDCPFDWLGADVPCDTETCPIPVPVESKSWGVVKNRFR